MVTAPTPTPVSVYPYSPNSSTSTFSLALDPIAESSISPYPSTPSIASPSIETPSAQTFGALDGPPPNSVYAYPPPRHARRQSQIGLGQPPNSARPAQLGPPRTAFSTTFPQSNTELILYSYAQLKGTLSITPVQGVYATPEQHQKLNSVRAALLKRSVIGGGSMDITSSLNQPPGSHRRRPTHGRSSSFSTGLLSLLSPTSLVASASTPPATSGQWAPPTPKRAPSGFPPSPSPVNSRFPNTGGVGLGLGLPSGSGNVSPDEDIDPEAPLPTFEVQPAMLAVDLSLLPGESRTCTSCLILIFHCYVWLIAMLCRYVYYRASG